MFGFPHAFLVFVWLKSENKVELPSLLRLRLWFTLLDQSTVDVASDRDENDSVKELGYVLIEGEMGLASCRKKNALTEGDSKNEFGIIARNIPVVPLQDQARSVN